MLGVLEGLLGTGNLGDAGFRASVLDLRLLGYRAWAFYRIWQEFTGFLNRALLGCVGFYTNFVF